MASLGSVFLGLISISLLSFTQNLSEATTTRFLKEKSANYTSVAIVGVVFCKSCKWGGYVESMDATPITGAIVRVTCYHTNRTPISMPITTGANGYFYSVWPHITMFSPKKCRAYLGWSPYSFCKKPIYQNGTTSAPLEFTVERNMTHGLQAVYTAGVLLYGPTSNNTLCHVP